MGSLPDNITGLKLAKEGTSTLNDFIQHVLQPFQNTNDSPKLSAVQKILNKILVWNLVRPSCAELLDDELFNNFGVGSKDDDGENLEGPYRYDYPEESGSNYCYISG